MKSLRTVRLVSNFLLVLIKKSVSGKVLMCGGGEIRKMNSKKKPDSSAFSVTRGARNKVSSENIFFHDDMFWEQKGQRMKNIMEVKSSFRQRIIFNNVFFLLITKISSILYIWIKRPNNCFPPKTYFLQFVLYKGCCSIIFTSSKNNVYMF